MQVLTVRPRALAPDWGYQNEPSRAACGQPLRSQGRSGRRGRGFSWLRWGLHFRGPGSSLDRARRPLPPTPLARGQEAGRPPLSDETPAQGSLSLMKGSLCGAGRPLAKDKTTVCPPSLAGAGASPRAGQQGGGRHRCAPSSLAPSSLSPSQNCSTGLGPSRSCLHQGVLAPDWGA